MLLLYLAFSLNIRIEPASKYIFSGILNHCILTRLFATLFIFIRFTDDTFAVVEFPPNVPHPKVSDGIFVLYISPIAPCVDGEFTIILPYLYLIWKFSYCCFIFWMNYSRMSEVLQIQLVFLLYQFPLVHPLLYNMIELDLIFL